MDVTRLMIEYLKTRNKELLVPLDYDIDSKTLTVIVTNILSWIKLEKKREIWREQGRKSQNKPLELNDKYSWCAILVELVGIGVFSKYFCIKDSKLDFLDTITKEEISNIRTYVYENYNPQKHTYERGL